MTLRTRDITDLMVCRAYRECANQSPATDWPYTLLARQTGAPEKVCYRACERAAYHNLIDYGTSLRSGWLTHKGRELLRQNEGTE